MRKIPPSTTAVLTLAGAAILAVAQSPAAVSASSWLAGFWEAKLNGVPAIDLRIAWAEGRISGAIVLYLHERGDARSPWSMTAEYSVPLPVPRMTDETDWLAGAYRRCHSGAELVGNARFRVELAGPNGARLWRLGYQEIGAFPGLRSFRKSTTLVTVR